MNAHRNIAVWGTLLVTYALAGCEPAMPLSDGTYTFTHRFAEHPSIPSITVTVEINGKNITVTNNDNDSVFPFGEIDGGLLLWHADTAQWIIGLTPEDAFAPAVGGCSAGPSVIDLTAREYWTC